MQDELKDTPIVITTPGMYVMRRGDVVEITDVTSTGGHGAITQQTPMTFSEGSKPNAWHVVWSLDGRLWQDKPSAFDIVARQRTNSTDYAKKGGTCPVCGHDAATHGITQVTSRTAYGDCFCPNCSATWKDVFVLAGYEQLDQHNS